MQDQAKLRAEYLKCAIEWLDLESQNDLVNNERSNELSDRMEEITTELGANREVVIVVRGGVAEIARNTDESDNLVTIIDFDNLEAEAQN